MAFSDDPQCDLPMAGAPRFARRAPPNGGAQPFDLRMSAPADGALSP